MAEEPIYSEDEFTRVRRQAISAEQTDKFESYAAEIFAALGLDLNTEATRDTPRRFSVQERLGQQLADTLNAVLQPHSVAVYLDARHLCVEMRGVREIAPVTRTSFWRGNCETDSALRGEFLSICEMKRG
jgi:GTP cyclohydrolase I